MNLCAWAISLILLPVIVFGDHPFYQHKQTASPLEFALFETLNRIAWAISLSYMVFACVHNRGGPVNKFLSLKMWQPLSRLTYAIYLIHCLVMLTIYLSMKTPPHFSAMSAFQNFIAIFVISVIVAIPLVLAFEFPIDAINKLCTGPKRPRIHTTSTSNNLRNSEKYIEKNIF